MQAPARHAYKLHSNFERTSPADSTYIQEYTVADDLSLIPGEVLYAGTYDECVKLHNALQDGSMTAEQVKAQAQAKSSMSWTDGCTSTSSPVTAVMTTLSTTRAQCGHWTAASWTPRSCPCPPPR